MQLKANSSANLRVFREALKLENSSARASLGLISISSPFITTTIAWCQMQIKVK